MLLVLAETLRLMRAPLHLLAMLTRQLTPCWDAQKGGKPGSHPDQTTVQRHHRVSALFEGLLQLRAADNPAGPREFQTAAGPKSAHHLRPQSIG